MPVQESAPFTPHWPKKPTKFEAKLVKFLGGVFAAKRLIEGSLIDSNGRHLFEFVIVVPSASLVSSLAGWRGFWLTHPV